MLKLELSDLNGKKRESSIRENSELVNILLKDRTTGKNIILAHKASVSENKKKLTKPIEEKWVTTNNDVFQSRVDKNVELQKARTKAGGEVFTPTWIVDKQVREVEKEFSRKPLNEYVGKKWLEITCGEAPYICSRYDATNGDEIPIKRRVGFLDKKLQRISKEIDSKKIWLENVVLAYQSSYGYEFQGDSLFIARKNLLQTFFDYYEEKFGEDPQLEEVMEIAFIISYNIFQMDGLNYTISFSGEIETRNNGTQLSLFEGLEKENRVTRIKEGKKVKIKDWVNNQVIEFEKIIFEGDKVMKFDVVIGNPPYQETIENRGEQPAIYNSFMDSAFKLSKKVCLITPARFLFNVGSTPKKWNEKMINDEHLKVIFFSQKSTDLFPTTDIKGGVVITYRDSEKKIGPIGSFTTFEELNSILNKVVHKTENFKPLGTLLYSNTSYKYSKALFEEHPEFESRLSGGSKRYLASSVFDVLPEIFFDKEPEGKKEYVQVLGRQDNQRKFKYINRKYLLNHPNMNKYKVFVPSSNGTGAIGEILSTPLIGEPLIGEPLIGATETFISFGEFDSRYEAESLLKYIKTKFARTMLGVLKVTQGNKTQHVWSKVPLQNFTQNSDIDWTQSISDIDKQLYKKYNLSQNEVVFIEKHVREME